MTNTFRIATFNLESLDAGRSPGDLNRRIEILRPQLLRLAADILCLQEVNAQHVHGAPERVLSALDALLKDTPYAGYARATSHGNPQGRASDVHNLVVLSRFPITAHRDLLHCHVPPLAYRPVTAMQREPEEIRFDRPVLVAEIELPDGTSLAVLDAHLRAPRAAVVKGQKRDAQSWASASGWAEGFLIASLKRNAQALEMRLEVDRLLDADPQRAVVVAGDLNAQDGEVPLKILIAAEDDTGNSTLAARALVPLERGISADRRFSVIHNGRPQMLDHILVSRALLARSRTIAIHNEALVDEAASPSARGTPVGSFHAPVVADFWLGDALGASSSDRDDVAQM